MDKIEKLQKLFYNYHIDKIQNRRIDLCNQMMMLENKGIDCFNCTGICCSFIANSMQVTPLEAIEIILYLNKEERLTTALIEKLKETVSDYRLDYHLDTGNGKDLRRTYNCPFYTPGSKGCALSRSIKPLGCLAFNPGKLNTKEGEACAPGFELLEKNDEIWGKVVGELNQKIRIELNLYWEKLPLPLALLELLK